MLSNPRLAITWDLPGGDLLVLALPEREVYAWRLTGSCWTIRPYTEAEQGAALAWAGLNENQYRTWLTWVTNARPLQSPPEEVMG